MATHSDVNSLSVVNTVAAQVSWIVTAQATARLAARMVMLDDHGAGVGAPRCSEGYVGLSRRR
jgi:hypothetical protein